MLETLTTYADSVPPLKYGLCGSTVNYKARILQLESREARGWQSMQGRSELDFYKALYLMLKTG